MEVLAWGLEGESWSMGYEIFTAIRPGKRFGMSSTRSCWGSSGTNQGGPCGSRRQVWTRAVTSPTRHTISANAATAATCGRSRARAHTATPIANPMDKKRSLRGKPVMLGVDTAKDTIHARLKVDEPGPGYCHFPEDYDEEFFKQLTGEKRVTKFVKGVPQRRWVKKSESRRVEALDCRVYNLAAYAILNPNMKKILEKVQREREETPQDQEKTAVKKNIRRRSMGAAKGNGFVNGW